MRNGVLIMVSADSEFLLAVSAERERVCALQLECCPFTYLLCDLKHNFIPSRLGAQFCLPCRYLCGLMSNRLSHIHVNYLD